MTTLLYRARMLRAVRGNVIAAPKVEAPKPVERHHISLAELEALDVPRHPNLALRGYDVVGVEYGITKDWGYGAPSCKALFIKVDIPSIPTPVTYTFWQRPNGQGLAASRNISRDTHLLSDTQEDHALHVFGILKP